MQQFFIPMIPPTITDQCKKISTTGDKVRTYNPRELVNAKAKFKAASAPYRPQKPLEGPLRLTTKWLFPVVGKHRNGEYKYTKPDTDNLIKALKDVLVSVGFCINDAQVASEITEKFWSDTPGIFIKIEELDNV